MVSDLQLRVQFRKKIKEYIDHGKTCMEDLSAQEIELIISLYLRKEINQKTWGMIFTAIDEELKNTDLEKKLTGALETIIHNKYQNNNF
jgi:hypothetical protein